MSIGQRASPDQQLVSVPFRIEPSTGPRPLRLIVLLVALLLFAGFSAAALGVLLEKLPPVGSRGGISWSFTQNGKPSVDAAWVGLTFTSIAAMVTVYNLMREIVYLRPGGSYWIGISRDAISLVSPLGVARYDWDCVSPFVVRSLPMRGWRILRITARTSRFGWLCLRSDDFSTGLNPSRRDAADELAIVLNDLLGQVGCGHQQTVSVPQGLRVTPIERELAKTPSTIGVVVRQQ